MKKLILSTFILFAASIFLSFFSYYSSAEFDEIAMPEYKSDDVVLIQISSDIKTSDVTEVKNVITTTLDNYDAGITVNNYETGHYEKFIYNYDYYLTKNITIGEEVSLIRKGDTFKVSDFLELTDVSFLSGEAFVICNSNCDQIVRNLSASLNIEIIEKEIHYNYFNNIGSIIFIVIGFMLIINVLIIFQMSNNFQMFSIRKLHGFSLRKIWIKEVIPLFFSQLVIMSLVFFILSLIFTSYSYRFILEGLKWIVPLVFITGAIISVPILIFARVKFLNYLKGQTESKFLLHFNQMTLSIILLITVSLLTTFSSTFVSYYSRYQNSAEWDRMKDFYLIPRYSMEIYENIHEDIEWQKVNEEAFIKLSEEGAIHADFYEFYIEENYPEDIGDAFSRAYVNSNYIDFHNLKDSDNNSILIDNNSTNHIVLLPDDHSISEKTIIDMYQFWYAHDEEKREIEFVYYDSFQTFFTHNSFIMNNFSNSLSKIPIHVVTYNNGDYFDYNRIVGYAHNPFKIKAESVHEVNNYFESNGFDRFGIKLDVISAYDDVNKMNQNEKNTLIGILITLCIIFLLINQSINQGLESFLAVHRKEIAIKRMYGYPVSKVFAEYFLMSAWYMLFNFIVLFFVTKSFVHSLGFTVLCIFLITVFLVIKLRRVYNSSLSTIFKGKEI